MVGFVGGYRWRLARIALWTACIVATVALINIVDADDAPVAAASLRNQNTLSPRDVVWVLLDGYTTITFDREALAERGLKVMPARGHRDGSRHTRVSPGTASGGLEPATATAPDFAAQPIVQKESEARWQTVTLRAVPGSELVVRVQDGSVDLSDLLLQHDDGLALSSSRFEGLFENLEIADDAALPLGDLAVRSGAGHGASALRMRGATIHVDRPSGTVTLTSDTLYFSPEVLAAMGNDGYAGGSIGSILFEGSFIAVQGRDSDVSGLTSSADLFPDSMGSVSGSSVGPDIIVISLISMNTYGSMIDPGLGERVSAYSVGATSCNIGDEPANWDQHSNEHPVIAQNVYRLHDGRFEQVGMSWLKHGFFAVLGTQCGECVAPPGITGTKLGVNCSDPYSAGLNGDQSNLGPRSEVNAFTGFFIYPFNRSFQQNVIDRRIQIKNSDLEPALTSNAKYFVEVHYVSADDAIAGNGLNNLSWRPVSFVRASQQACSNRDFENDFCAIVTSFTRTQAPAIAAWKLNDPDVVESDVLIPHEGMFKLSTKVTNLENGFWRFEYALFNLNSHRSAGSFRIPLPIGAVIQNVGFHAPFYHSGEPFSNDPWDVTIEGDAITWSTTPYDEDPNANALRWSTLYNFRFEANAGPQASSATIGLFRPGTPALVTGNTLGPAVGQVDCNANELPDACDISCEAPGCDEFEDCGLSPDCNGNSIPDVCEPDCNENDIPDQCDIADGTSTDCDTTGVPDECKPDCDGDGTPDICEISLDADNDGVVDCDDLCPETTPPDGCLCPPNDLCCFSTGFCIPDYPRQACLESGGTPACQTSPCRDGCMVGDWDEDGDLDLHDLKHMMMCYSGFSDGAGYQRPSDQCLLRFDFNGDETVDLLDYNRFIAESAGPEWGYQFAQGGN
jgi:hypothetical protein